MREKRKALPWLGVLLLCAVGIGIYLGLPGYSFSGLVVLGIAAIVSCFLLLKLLKKHHKKAAKVMTWILCICLCVGILAALFTGIVIGKAGAGSPDQSCQYLIVLGAGINGSTPSYMLSCRLNAAYTYLQEHPEAVCIVSGGQGDGEDMSEAQCMYDWLTGHGIDPERIWMEDKSTNTRENLRFSLTLIEEKTGVRPQTVGILSNEFHLYRAGCFARELGLDPVLIGAKTKRPGLLINYFLREIVAVWYYTLMGG